MPIPAKHKDGSPEERIAALGFALPPFPKPAGRMLHTVLWHSLLISLAISRTCSRNA